MNPLKILKMIGIGAKKMALPVIVIILLLGAGLYFKYFTSHIDHPVEQVIENVLDTNGIDVDFSKDKK